MSGIKVAVAEVLERWFNNKPTVLQDEECPPRTSSKHAPLDPLWAEPNPKKARHDAEEDDADTRVDAAPPTSPAIPVRRLVASALEVVAEQAAVTGVELLQLFSECVEFERSTTWVPLHANCSMCSGYCFAPTSDVARQLGVCGCVVATEMEMADAEARLERTKAIGRQTAWTFSEILSGTAFPIGGWPSVADVLSAALRPESPGAQPKPFSAIELKRRQLQDKLAHNKGAPLMPTTTSVELLLEPPLTHPPSVRTHLKRQQSQHQSKRAHINREAPRTTFYRRLGRRNM